MSVFNAKELIVMIKNGDSIINVQVQALAEDSDAISHAKNKTACKKLN